MTPIAAEDPDTDDDDDGLLDLEEIELGTDPLDPDSDGDSYSDRDEVVEQKDPLDPTSVIYKGGWPYYFEKTELKGGTRYEVGKRFANLQLIDQFGDLVSLWDFYSEDTYVVVDVCGAWCPICIVLSAWLGGETNPQFDEWIDVRTAVDAGKLRWVQALVMDKSGEPATPEDARAFAEHIPHDLVPVLADPEFESAEFVELRMYPTLVLLSPNLKVHTAMETDYLAVLDAAQVVLAGPSGTEP